MTAIIIYFSSGTCGWVGWWDEDFVLIPPHNHSHPHTHVRSLYTHSPEEISPEKVDEDGKDDGACSQEQPQIACQTPVGKLLAGILLL